MNVRAIKTRIFREGEDLFDFITEHIPALDEATVLAVTSKIVALCEGRVARPKNDAERMRIIESESDWMVATTHVVLTMKDGIPMANAGADESNADGKLVLLPKDSFVSAEKLREKLMKKFGLKKLGIVITDSRVVPMRAGVVGLAVGYAGIKGVRDYRGKPDVFGRKLRFTLTNIADGLATAAVLVAGEGKEQQPLVIIENAPVRFTDKVNRDEVRIDLKDDMYRPFFGRVADEDD
jgi:dihydrofolate synthase / folylpolyglutamate synthase